jgi:hypothetical protein
LAASALTSEGGFLPNVSHLYILPLQKKQFISVNSFGKGEGKTTAQKRYMIG